MSIPTISPSDPAIIIAGIRQFGLASDGSDLRDLENAFAAIRAQTDITVIEAERQIAQLISIWVPHGHLEAVSNIIATIRVQAAAEATKRAIKIATWVDHGEQRPKAKDANDRIAAAILAGAKT